MAKQVPAASAQRYLAVAALQVTQAASPSHLRHDIAPLLPEWGFRLPVSNIYSSYFKTSINTEEWGFRPTTFIPIVFKPCIDNRVGFPSNNICSDL